MNPPATIECAIHFRRRGRGRAIELGPQPVRPARPPGRVPRVSRFMALAIRFGEYLGTGQVGSYRELAQLGRVSRPRISQIMNLLNLAPDLQEALLLMPRTERGRDAIILRALQPLASTPVWHKQRRLWVALRDRAEAASPRAERP
ncbi:MAG TPA: hypothetical protein VG013_21375 [Gemmataceae bacterium]|jgi:hypothetical protein|nr:hypothetical protein [Gemmataceae bacterium]